MRVILAAIALGLWALVVALLSQREWHAERPQTRIIERYTERVVPVPQYVKPEPKPKPRIGPPLKLHPDYK